jgi:hypothetical protein
VLNRVTEFLRNHLAASILGPIAAIITIATFFTGKQNFPDNWTLMLGLLSNIPSIVWYCLAAVLGGALIGYSLGRGAKTTRSGTLQNDKGSQLNHTSLISSRESLISKYGLNIISATYGIDVKATADVTEQVILGLAEKGKIFVDNDLVGGDEHDPVKNVEKELKVIYIQGNPSSKSIPERSILSIEDLIQDLNDNEPEGPRDFGPTQKSRWTK